MRGSGYCGQPLPPSYETVRGILAVGHSVGQVIEVPAGGSAVLFEILTDDPAVARDLTVTAIPDNSIQVPKGGTLAVPTKVGCWLRVTWGIGNLNTAAVVDVANGHSFTVRGTHLAVEAINPLAVPATFGASASYGRVASGVWPTNTFPLIAGAGPFTAVVPPFGRAVKVVRGAGAVPSPAFDLVIADVGANVISITGYGANADMPWLELPGSAASYLIIFTAAITGGAVIHKLAL